MPPDPRQRMIQSAALLMREHGVEGTSFTQVLEHSGAPRGSIYHHFPDGKAQLVGEATRFAGDFIAAGLVAALAQDDLVLALRAFTTSWRTVLKDSAYAAGCPVVAATLEGDRTPTARDAAGDAFERWQTLVADAFQARGVTRDRAISLAALTIASIEGAVILARAQQSTAPLDGVAAELELLATGVIQSV